MESSKIRSSSSHHQEQSSLGKNSFRGRRPYSRGRGGGFFGKCFKCNKYGHRLYECLENLTTSQRSAHIAQAKEESHYSRKESY